MMFNFYPWGLSVNIVRPISIKKTKVSFLSYVWDESKLRQGAGGDLHKVELEDEDIVQNVQKGIRSKNNLSSEINTHTLRFYSHGRYSRYLRWQHGLRWVQNAKIIIFIIDGC
jgi:choline monooxygenase